MHVLGLMRFIFMSQTHTAVAQSVRAFAIHAKDLVLESRMRHTNQANQIVTAPLPKARQQVLEV